MSRQENNPTGQTIIRDEPVTATTTGPVVTDTQRRTTVAGPVTWEEMRALLRREPMVTERTWRPTVGGLLEILAGSWNFLLGLGATIGGTVFADLIPTIGGISGGLDTTTRAVGIFFLVIGLVAIIGGAMALARRGWPWVLAGSILSLIPSPIIFPFVLGIFALLFNVLGHKEFWGPKEFQKDYQSNVQHSIDKSK